MAVFLAAHSLGAAIAAISNADDSDREQLIPRRTLTSCKTIPRGPRIAAPALESAYAGVV